MVTSKKYLYVAKGSPLKGDKYKYSSYAITIKNILLLPALRIVPGLYSIYVLHISNFLSLAHICWWSWVSWPGPLPGSCWTCRPCWSSSPSRYRWQTAGTWTPLYWWQGTKTCLQGEENRIIIEGQENTVKSINDTTSSPKHSNSDSLSSA